jgi:hypothetical protein
MDYDCVGLDRITYDMTHYGISFDMKQSCYCLTRFYGNSETEYPTPVSIESLLILFNLNDKII